MKPENIKVYKIMNGAGKYSIGGMSCDRVESCWTSRGKTWTGLGAVKGHLRQYIEQHYNSGKTSSPRPDNPH